MHQEWGLLSISESCKLNNGFDNGTDEIDFGVLLWGLCLPFLTSGEYLPMDMMRADLANFTARCTSAGCQAAIELLFEAGS